MATKQSKRNGAKKSADLSPNRIAYTKPKGALVIIGGHEDKKGDRLILREIARRVGAGKLVVATLATKLAGELWDEYRRVFTDLGIKRIEHLNIHDRAEVVEDPDLERLEGARAVFFTGGDQLQITSHLGGTEICRRIQTLYLRGGLVAGTSAGAAMMSETMLVSGDSEETYKVGSDLMMAPGLGFIHDLVVDQHFAERGRIGRLLGVVAQNPRLLCVGIDEDTALLVEKAEQFQVMGSGAVYVVDGRDLTHANISEEEKDRTLSLFDVRLHLLSQGDRFDLNTWRPEAVHAEEVEKRLPAKRGQAKSARSAKAQG